RGSVRKEIGLGGYGQGTAPVSLALAREKADAIRERLARGEDLMHRKSFADVMDDVIAVKEASFRNEKHKAQWRMTLDKYAAPLHAKPIADITRDDDLHGRMVEAAQTWKTAAGNNVERMHLARWIRE